MKISFFCFTVILFLTTRCHSTQKNATPITENQIRNKFTFSQVQSFFNYTWSISSPAFFHKDQKTYKLQTQKTDKRPAFGHFVTFKKDGTFSGYYTAPCGNDCFTSIDGHYKINDFSNLEIFVKNAEQKGYCNNPIHFSNKKRGTFKLTKQSDHILLERI